MTKETKEDETNADLGGRVDSLVMCIDNAAKTDEIDRCWNKGCGFDIGGNCTASGTQCFGYIKAG